MSTSHTQSLKNPNGNGQGKFTKRFNQMEDSEKQHIINYVSRLLDETETFDEAENALKRTIPFIHTIKADREYCQNYPHNNPKYL